MRLTQAIPALPVIDMAQAVDFYRDRFGFTLLYEEGGFARLCRDAVELHLWAASDESWRSYVGSTPPGVVSGAESFLAGTASCRIRVEGIDDLYAEYKETGVLYSSDTQIVTEAWGDRDFHTLDLHRNLLTFFEPLAKQ